MFKVLIIAVKAWYLSDSSGVYTKYDEKFVDICTLGVGFMIDYFRIFIPPSLSITSSIYFSEQLNNIHSLTI